MILSAIVTIALLIGILFVVFGGSNYAREIAPLRERLDALNLRLDKLQSRPQAASPVADKTLQARSLEQRSGEIVKSISSAVSANATQQIDQLRKESKELLESVEKLLGSAAAPTSNTGSVAVEARELAGGYEDLETELGSSSEKISESGDVTSPKAAAALADITELISATQTGAAKARKLAGPPAVSSEDDKGLVSSLERSRSMLSKAQAELNKYAPPAPMPFAGSEATLRITTTSELASTLLEPLLAKWGEAEYVSGSNGLSFVDSSKRSQKILVKGVSADEGFASLAKSETDLLLIDQQPKEQELASLGSGFGSNRSTAEVVAMDALTLLVHPNNSLDTFEVGKKVPLTILAGPMDSDSNRRAVEFGFHVGKESTTTAADAALSSPDVLALGLYHQEGGSPIKAKRIEVKPSSDTLALKPSPFTIATEDYLYSFRIVAWNPPKPKPAALEFVRFVTSDAGQEIVEKAGYVDLRLRPIEGSVDPRILAALGSALGVSKIQSAVRLSTNFRFAVGKADFDLKAQADLERLPRYLASSYPNHKVVILGFTDKTGPSHLHLPLSKERAKTVADQLSGFKVDTSIGGLGCDFPLDTDETEAGRSRNRRSEVWVAKP